LSHSRVFTEQNFGGGGMWFYKGFRKNKGAKSWFFDGENVVKRVVSLVLGYQDFKQRKFSSF
jgi:hypothetical protein